MSAGIIILIVIILVLLAATAVAASRLTRRKAARRTEYGPEYDRLAEAAGPQQANAEFAKRRQRVDSLHIRPLSEERRAAYAGQWEAAQEQFVDQPAQAVDTAGSLVTAVAVDRGYEAADPDQLMADLSVHHGRYLDGYRHARQLTEQASTEERRRALLDYRGIFFDLLEPAGGGASGPAPAAATAAALDDRPWQQVTQGRHWKTQQQESGDATVTRP